MEKRSQLTVWMSWKTMDTLPPEVRYVSSYDLEPFKRGRKVGYYLLGRVVGAGSFAKVREGVHILTGEKVAVKIIDKKRAREDRYISKNLRREAKILQLIRHAHIVQLLEVLETDNFYYLVMEFCAGGELLDYICARKRLDETSARKLIGQLVSAVDVMHRAGIVHRDLKIENFLLTEDDDLKIIDFGLSNTIPASCVQTFEKTGTFAQLLNTHCGSPAYAAPELLAQKNYGPQVDVWSIGINMYAMLTGFLPYMMEPFNVMEMYEKMMQRKMTPIPGFLSKECRDLLMRLLEPVPEWRISLQQVMKHKWFGNYDTWTPRALSLGDFMYNKKELCESVLNYMKTSLKIKDKDTMKAVVSNKALHASAVYHLLVKRLDRYIREGGKNDHTSATNNFSKLQIVKKATLPSSDKMTGITDNLDSAQNGKAKRFTFRGRKISSSTKSQPSLTSAPQPAESPKTKITRTPVKDPSSSEPSTVCTQSEKDKIIVKKEKVVRTCSDDTHRRKKHTSEQLPPSTLSKPLDSTPENAENKTHRHKRCKRSASSSENEEDVRYSIRNSLTGDSDDFLKPVDVRPDQSRVRSRSPLDPFARDDETVFASRKISFDNTAIDSFEQKSAHDDSSEAKSMANKELEKLVSSPYSKRRGSFLETNEIEDKTKEKKETFPGWLITKIVKQPPLKSEYFPGEGTNAFVRKLRENEVINVHRDHNNNGITNRGDNLLTMESTLPEKDDISINIMAEKAVSANNLNVDRNDKSEEFPMNSEVSETKLQNTSSDTINKPRRKENVNYNYTPENVNYNYTPKENVNYNYTPMRRAITSDSITICAEPAHPFSSRGRAMSSDNINTTDRIQNMQALSELIQTKTRAYNKILTSLKNKNSTDDLREGTATPGICSSGQMTAQLENILSNIEYINTHHLNKNNDRIEKNEKPGISGWPPLRKRSCSADSTSIASAKQTEYGTNQANINTCTPTTEEYANTVRTLSHSYSHEGIWKPPERLDVSNNKPTANHSKVNRTSSRQETDIAFMRPTISAEVSKDTINPSNCDNLTDPRGDYLPRNNLRPAASTPPGSVVKDFDHPPIKATKSCDVERDKTDAISPKTVIRHRIAKLESFKKNYPAFQSPYMENKVNSSINKITPPKKVVELNVGQLALFKNISSSKYEQGIGASVDSLNTDGSKRLSLTLKPLEISFDFAEMQKRARMLKNQAKSMPNVNDLDDNGDDTSPTHHTSHGYNSPVGIEMATSTVGFPHQGRMSHIHGQKRYYSSLSLATSESLV